MINFKRIQSNGKNASLREVYVEDWICSLSRDSRLIDVGSGEMPFKESIKARGIDYLSHDFENYNGSDFYPGLQSHNWPTSGHDYVSDILDIELKDFDYVLCTEVLEHVPDPALAIKKLSELITNSGEILITVPFASRMHQAPYWYSAGLSPFWFTFHAEKNGLFCKEIVVVGDFVDQMIQEIPLLFSPMRKCIKIGVVIGYLLRITLLLNKNIFRRLLPVNLLESGGQAVFVILKKID